jgi:enamine deaminase RidA (YjgF/YER057c/UK114 family)
MDFTGADVSTQTEQVMQNMGAILEAGGSSFAEVVKCTILLTDMQHFATVNDIYAKCNRLPSTLGLIPNRR